MVRLILDFPTEQDARLFVSACQDYTVLRGRVQFREPSDGEVMAKNVDAVYTADHLLKPEAE